MKRDLVSLIAIGTSLAAAARTASANGTGVDLAGYGSAAVVFAPGAITDGTHTPSLEESSDNATFTAVAAADMIGTLAALAANTVQEVGYVGTKRYIRAVTTITGSPATGGVYNALVVRGNASKQPA